ncbi:MAG: hypothetical protein AAB776_01340 [Patescibacteria group bacterium]
MTISGELRGERFQPHERREAKNISNGDRATIENIETIIKDKRANTVGSGRSADVILLDIWAEETGLAPWVIKQENRRTREQDALGTTLDDEFITHDKAYSLIEAAKARHPEKIFAKIPKPLSTLTHEEKRWFIMEYVPGETLFERSLKVFLLTHNQDDDATLSPEIIKHMQRDELIDTLSEDEYRNLLPPRLVEEMNNNQVEISEEHFFFIGNMANKATKGPSRILTPEQQEKIENTISELHRHGIWHRDLHPSNVQLMPDGDVAILDFGLSLSTERGKIPERGVYTIDLSNNFQEKVLRLPSDEDMISTYQKISRKIK